MSAATTSQTVDKRNGSKFAFPLLAAAVKLLQFGILRRLPIEKPLEKYYK